MCHTGECGCMHPVHHYWSRCALGYPARRFPTKEETIAQLEDYLKQLQEEAKGVGERISELKKTE